MAHHHTRISSPDFDHFVGDVAGDIWNAMVQHQSFRHLQPKEYADLFEAVSRALAPYHSRNSHHLRARR